MVELRETIARLSRSFVAADIMTPHEKLNCGTDRESAKRLLEENTGFDVIPIRQGDRITSFLSQEDQSKLQTIQIQHLVSLETPIIDVIDTLENKKFVFVIGQRQVVGYIHFSDLNDPVVKIPFFVLLEGLERVLSDPIREMITDDNLSKIFKDGQRVKVLVNKMTGLRKDSADRDWVTLMYFREVLEAAIYFKKVELEIKDIEALAAVRSDVFHAASKRELVESHNDVRRLQKVRDICLSLLQPPQPNPV